MVNRRSVRRRSSAVAFLVAVAAAFAVAVPAPSSAATRSCSDSTSVANRPQLRYGDSGSCVKVLQRLLLAKRIAIGSSYADGHFGPGMRLGVRHYQSTQAGLDVDGVVGPHTWGRLVSGGGTAPAPAPAPTPAPAAKGSCSNSTPVASRPQLRYGDSGSCVKVLQNLLLAKGFAIGSSSADGHFGPGARLGVRRYQSTRLDLSIDGVVGPNTWNRLVRGGGTAYSTSRGPNTSSRVMLTYDDCPKSLSAFKSTVVAARNLGIALVLAPTGNCISAGRFSASYARSYGHYVINHSVSHADLRYLSTSSILRQLGPPGVATSFGRPPYGAVNERVRNAYATKGMRMWLWTDDTNDWRGKSRTQVVNYVVGHANAGDTFLMHMQWNGFSSSAMSSMKSGLAARGLGVCRNSRTTTPTYPSRVVC